MTDPVWRTGWSVHYDHEGDVGSIVHNDAGINAIIQFQHGPVQEVGGINGVQNEELIELLVQRIKALDLRMPCEENRNALENLERALDWLYIRTKNRTAQGVEGTERPHSSTETRDE